MAAPSFEKRPAKNSLNTTTGTIAKRLDITEYKRYAKEFFAPFTPSRRRILTCKGCGGLTYKKADNVYN